MQYENIRESEVLVTSGAEEAIFIFMNVALKRGDHVIVQHPCYQSLKMKSEGEIFLPGEVDKIITEIEELRQKLHRLAEDKGFQDREIIKISKSMDDLLNEYE